MAAGEDVRIVSKVSEKSAKTGRKLIGGFTAIGAIVGGLKID